MTTQNLFGPLEGPWQVRDPRRPSSYFFCGERLDAKLDIICTRQQMQERYCTENSELTAM